MGEAIFLSDNHLELLSRTSLVGGKGGHQSFFRELAKQRKGNRQTISRDQIKHAQERLQKLAGAGTWQQAYSAILSYFPIQEGRPSPKLEPG